MPFVIDRTVEINAAASAAHGTAAAYRDLLLAGVGAGGEPAAAVPEEHPALAWARSGLMALTGPAGGAPQMCPLPIAAAA
ncbi:MAG: hypothetical protein QM661_15040, partial [Solimonas sp.]